MSAAALLSQSITRHGSMVAFYFHGHRVLLVPSSGEIECDTCAVPAVIAHAIRFMHAHLIMAMMIDGVEVLRA